MRLDRRASVESIGHLSYLRINPSFKVNMLRDWSRILAAPLAWMCFSLFAIRPTLARQTADVPEEMLQVSITERANSQLDGRAQTSREQASEQRQLRVAPEDVPTRLAPEVQQAVVLLRIRKLLKSLIPLF
jgi:hypothetical protein